ncbi:MAG: alpha/beta hydrolase [Novosphingobium sp.]|nr:alpha/beta hydrolase [Novosphingobium sp.]
MGAINFALLHGGGQGSWVWDETIAELERQSAGAARCLALDAPGCGTKRGRDTSAIAFDDIARELADDIRASGMTDVIVVGHSQAGMELPQIAALASDLVRKLVFVTCSAPLPGKTTLDQMGSGVHGQNPDEVGWPVDPETSTIAERFSLMFCNDMGPDQTTEFLGKLGKDMWPACCYSHSDWRRDHLADVPVTYVKCLKDKSLPPEWQDRFAERLHTDKVVRIDAGHQVMNTKPGELAELLLAESA